MFDLEIININVYFSPENNVERIIDERLKKAKKSIRFMAFSFTSDKIGETMIDKYKSGVIVEGVLKREEQRVNTQSLPRC
jgi:hypothetical protein